MRESEVKKIYYKELGVAGVVYVALLFGGLTFSKTMHEGLARTIVLMSPMLGFGLMIWAIARQVRRMDEYMRQLTLETIGISAAVTAALSFTYGFLEGVGYPRLSMFWVWGVMGATAGVTALVRRACRDE